MAPTLGYGIDVGTTKVVAVAGRVDARRGWAEVLSIGEAPSYGLQRGVGVERQAAPGAAAGGGDGGGGPGGPARGEGRGSGLRRGVGVGRQAGAESVAEAMDACGVRGGQVSVGIAGSHISSFNTEGTLLKRSEERRR